MPAPSIKGMRLPNFLRSNDGILPLDLYDRLLVCFRLIEETIFCFAPPKSATKAAMQLTNTEIHLAL
jgi:hypothetical protein